MAHKILYFTTFENARAWAAERNLTAKVSSVSTGNGEEPGFYFIHPDSLEIECWAVVRERKFWVCERETAQPIDWFPTLQEAMEHRNAWEANDREAGKYQPDMYEIVEDATTEFEDLGRGRQTIF